MAGQYSFLCLCVLLTLARADNLCEDAKGCWCFNTGPGGVRADCNGEHIEYVPSNLPLNLTELKIEHSSLSILRNGNLSMYGDLTTLDLMYNDMYRVEDGALGGLSNIEVINLHSNNLTELPDDSFTDKPSLKTLRVYNNALKEIPVVRNLANLENLELQMNQIELVSSNSFQGLTSLLSLNLHDNLIEDIATGSFSDLDKVTVLILSENSIPAIHSGDFNGLTGTIALHLQGNEISDLPENAFQGLSSLKNLHISSNQISTIHDMAFTGAGPIENIDLDYNKLTEVPLTALSKLNSLIDLELSGNLLETLRANAFSSLSKLKEVFLSDMPSLLEVELDAFKDMNTLEIISLSKNPNLTEFTPEHLPDDHVPALITIRLSDNGFEYLSRDLFQTKAILQAAYIQGNPFHCDCELKWIPRVIESGEVWAKHWIDAGSAPGCGHPPHLEMIPISEMVEMDLTCDKVDIKPVTPQRVTAYLRGNSTFKAELFNGFPESMWKTPGGEWLRPNPIIPPDDRRYDVKATPDEDHVIMAYFNIDNSSLADEGDYLLLTTNIEGNVTYTFHLEVLPYELTVPVTSPGPSAATYVSPCVITTVTMATITAVSVFLSFI